MLNVILVFLLCGLASAALAETPASTDATIPAAYQLTVADAEAAAAEALSAKGVGTRVHADIMGARKPVLYQGSKPLKAGIGGLSFDKTQSRWSANLLVLSGDTVLTAMPVSGRYQEIVQLPVLKRQVRSGETIGEHDIDLLDFPLARMRADVVTEAKQLIGFSPRATIAPRRPVRITEISTPAVIKKSALVVMRAISGNMEITASGQALSDGARGDTIEVRNLTSKTVIRATVQDAQTVQVGMLPSTRQLAGDTRALGF